MRLLVNDILVLKLERNVVSVLGVSDEEEDSVGGRGFELELDHELVFEVDEVRSIHRNEPLTAESDAAFRPFLQFVPELN
jgi:hypothetical protein